MTTHDSNIPLGLFVLFLALANLFMLVGCV